MRGVVLGVGFLAADGAVGLLQAAAASTTAATTRRDRRIMGVSWLKEPHSYWRH
jgi:hypothetical protein